MSQEAAEYPGLQQLAQEYDYVFYAAAQNPFDARIAIEFDNAYLALEYCYAMQTNIGIVYNLSTGTQEKYIVQDFYLPDTYNQFIYHLRLPF